MTRVDLKLFLQANVGLSVLDLSGCRMGPECIDLLVEHAPQLKTLSVRACGWFTDECLDRLVQGQIDYCMRGGRKEISLGKVLASRTKVTAAGIDRVKPKPHVGRLSVSRVCKEVSR